MFKKLIEKHKTKKEDKSFIYVLNNMQDDVSSSIVSSLLLDVLNLQIHTTEFRDEINPNVKILNHVDDVISYFNNNQKELRAATKKAVRVMFSLDELVDVFHHPLRMETDKTTYEKCLKFFERVYNDEKLDANAIMYMILEYEIKGSKIDKTNQLD
jgi:hypothetical protein